MGDEYFITSKPSAVADLTALSIRLGGNQISAEPLTFEFRSPAALPSAGMPDFVVTISPEELYFCENGGPPEYTSVLFRRFLDTALSHNWPEGIRIAQE
jgi:hypothetical protein